MNNKWLAIVLGLGTTAALGVAACQSSSTPAPVQSSTGGTSGAGGSIGTAGMPTVAGAGGTAAAGTSSTGVGGSTAGSTASGGTTAAGTGGTGTAGTTSTGAGGTSTSTGGTTGAAGTTCNSTKLYPPDADAGANTLYCPFSANADAGADASTADISCNPSTTHCCETTAAEAIPSYCAPTATACATGESDWQCADSVDCTGGMVCCGVGTIGSDGPGCANYVSKFGGTHCAASCQTGEFQLCSQDSSCTAPATCMALDTKANHVGSCM